MANLWFDLTNSMNWQYGRVVGLIRVELEVGAALVKLRPDVRFSMYKNGAFVELSERDVPWLYSGAGNVADEYFKHRRPREEIGAQTKSMEYLKALDKAMPNRGLRLQYALKILGDAAPQSVRPLVRALLYPASAGVKALGWAVGKKNAYGLKMRLPYFHRPSSKVNDEVLRNMQITYPFKEGDTVISFGWYGSGKELGFAVARANVNFKLVYFIYDLVLANEQTKFLYPSDIVEKFESYLSWTFDNCDFLLYGGETVKADAEAYQKKHDLPSPPSRLAYYGASELSAGGTENDDEILKKLGVTRNFILSVGSMECKKNQEVLYKALILLNDAGFAPLPQLVFAGGQPLYQTTIDFLDTVKRDLRAEGNIILAKEPSDEELDALYRNCLFTVLPSAYEGWSVIVQESFKYGKFCLASDVAPLREVGGELADYVRTFDPVAWSEKISFYIANPDKLAAREQKIVKNWSPMSWLDVGKQVLDGLDAFDKMPNLPSRPKINLWYDLSTTYLFWPGRIEGVIRTELILAYYLHKTFPNMRFFGFWGPHFMEIAEDKLSWLFNFSDLSRSFAKFQNLHKQLEMEGQPNSKIDWDKLLVNMDGLSINKKVDEISNTIGIEKITLTKSWRNSVAMFLSVLPDSFNKKILSLDWSRRIIAEPDRLEVDEKGGHYNAQMKALIEETLEKKGPRLPFGSGDIVFSAGININVSAQLDIIRAKRQTGFFYVPIIYDLTPQLFPQLHVPKFAGRYETFFYLNSLAADTIIYGGETAMRDGLAWQKKKGWPQPPGLPIKFGSDLIKGPAENRQKGCDDDEKPDDAKLLRALGVKSEYLLSVGTLQVRKNHETIYRAYVELMESGYERLPQMVFVGNVGWKAKGLFELIERDKRLSGKILMLQVSDTELEALYRNCRFTLLPSLYEGWSLTLPESLCYGKFCLTAKVDPLMETGGDMVEYVEPWNVAQWAEKIKYYCDNDEALKERERRIEKEWKPITWAECARDLASKLQQLKKDLSPASTPEKEENGR